MANNQNLYAEYKRDLRKQAITTVLRNTTPNSVYFVTSTLKQSLQSQEIIFDDVWPERGAVQCDIKPPRRPTCQESQHGPQPFEEDLTHVNQEKHVKHF